MAGRAGRADNMGDDLKNRLKKLDTFLGDDPNKLGGVKDGNADNRINSDDEVDQEQLVLEDLTSAVDDFTDAISYKPETSKTSKTSKISETEETKETRETEETEEREVAEEEIPEYLLDNLPEGKIDKIKWYLLHGRAEDQLVADGYNLGTIRNCMVELRREGLYGSVPEGIDDDDAPRKSKGNGEGKSLIPVSKGKLKGRPTDLVPKARVEKELKLYSRGSPAEELIEHFAKLPDDIRDGRGQIFESGMKFGLSVAVLGIRMAQELSNLGVSQVKPLIDMTKSMREGEALAAKSAAREAADETAGQIGDMLGPTLQEIRTSMAEQSKARPASSSSDPMRDMIADTFRPVLKSITKQMMPAGMEEVADQAVSGWTKRRRAAKQPQERVEEQIE